MIEIGKTVSLRKSVKHHTCPEGRENNKTAIVVGHIYGDNTCLWLNRDLRGCRGWNEADVNVVSSEEN